MAYFTSSDLTAYIDQTFMKLIITFTKPVDTSQVDSCDLMFPSYVLKLLGDGPSCAWSADFKSIIVVLGTDYSLRKMPISLISDNLGALNDNCTDNKQDLNVTVNYTTTRVPPNAVITVPSSYSPVCGSGLQLSGLGSTNTRGQSIQYRWLLTLLPSASGIDLYANYSSGNGKIVIPNNRLTDESLNVTLLIRDNFGDVGSASLIVSLYESNPLAVSMDATNPFQITASQSVVISSKIQQPCGNGLETYTYLWQLYSENKQVINSYLQTSKTFQLRIAPNSLSAGEQYMCTLSVTGPNSQGSSQISVIVLSTPLSIVFDRSDGDQSIDTDLVIDASNSTDPDNPSAALKFTWNCSEAASKCLSSKLQPLNFTSGPQLIVSATDLRIGATYQFALLLQSGSKQLLQSIEITIIKSVSISFKIPSLNTKLSPGESHILYPSVNATNDTTYQWTQISGKPIVIATPLNVPWIKLGAGQIQSGEVYKFALTLTQNSGSITQIMQVSGNLSPTHGSLSVSPSSGVAIADDFTMEARAWDDPDGTGLPLTYQFGVILDTGGTLSMSTAQLSYSYVTFFFPGTLIATVSVCGSLGTCASANTSVGVTMPQQQRDLQSALSAIKTKFTSATATTSTIPSTVIAYAKTVTLIVDNQLFQMMLSASQTYMSLIAGIDNKAIQTQLSCCIALVSLTNVMSVNNIQNVSSFLLGTLPKMSEQITDANLQTAMGLFSNLTVTATSMKVINNYTSTLLQSLRLVPSDAPTIISGTQITLATVSVVAANSSSLNMVVGGTQITFPASFLSNMGIPTNSIADLRVTLYTPPGSTTPVVTINLFKSGSVSNGSVQLSTPTPVTVSSLTSPVNIGTSVSGFSASANYTAYGQSGSSNVWSTSGVSLGSMSEKNAVIQTFHFSSFKVDIRQVITIDYSLWPVLFPNPDVGCSRAYSPIILAEGYLAVCLFGAAFVILIYHAKKQNQREPLSPSSANTLPKSPTVPSPRNSEGSEEAVFRSPNEVDLQIIDSDLLPPKGDEAPEFPKHADDESLSIVALNPVFGVFRSSYKLSHLVLTLSLFLSEEMTVGIITKAKNWEVQNTYDPGNWSYLNFIVCLIGLGAGQVYSWFCTGLFLLVLAGKLPSQVFCLLMGTLAMIFNAVIIWLAVDMCDDERLNTWTSESISVLLVEVIVTSWVCEAIFVLVQRLIRT